MTLHTSGQGGDVGDPAPGLLLSHGESIAVADITDALVIKEGNLFLMTDADGNLPRGEDCGYGLYKGDTRYLSIYDLSLDGVAPTVLLSTADLGYGSEHHLTNPQLITADGRSVPKETIQIRRQRILNESLLETIQVTNYNPFPLSVRLRFDFAADFLDMFEFRGEKRRRRGRLFPPITDSSRAILAYQGLDVRRRTEIFFSPSPERVWDSGALCTVTLRHGESATMAVAVRLDDGRMDGPLPVELEKMAGSYRQWVGAATQVFTDNELFNTMLERSLRDIRTLAIETEDGGFVAAGTPWFSALFGRDSLITSFQMLAYNPQIARDTLRILARWQGRSTDDWRDEEPGKILHELRDGEMAAMNEIPMTPYYGSVDSTPLFLMLAAEYADWTGDMDLIRDIEPNLTAALSWIDGHISAGGSGYLRYAKRSAKGLLNQGWKDSHDGIVNGDGTLVGPPVALSEVQGYAYAALLGMAGLFDRLGKPELAEERRRQAADLQSRFNRDFWMEDEGFLALALGADDVPATSITTNAGQCLWTGVVHRGKAGTLVERLLRNDMFSGWGIRTLSSTSPRYNPLGYHLGSVWPHDNSLIAKGLKHYGFEEELDDLFTAIYDTCRHFDYYRLPELFCGVARSSYGGPVQYPVAARPQAWAAGAIPLFLQAVLGLAPDALNGVLRVVRPRLPHWLNRVEVLGLRVGEGTVDLLFENDQGSTRVSVIDECGVDVAFPDEWPERSPGT